MQPVKRALVLVAFLAITLSGGGLLMFGFISFVAPSLVFLPYFLYVILTLTGMFLGFIAGLLLGVTVWMLLMKPFVSRKEMNGLLQEQSPSSEFEYPVFTPLVAKLISNLFELIY